jgi:hypothetical protein
LCNSCNPFGLRGLPGNYYASEFAEKVTKDVLTITDYLEKFRPVRQLALARWPLLRYGREGLGFLSFFPGLQSLTVVLKVTETLDVVVKMNKELKFQTPGEIELPLPDLYENRIGLMDSVKRLDGLTASDLKGLQHRLSSA